MDKIRIPEEKIYLPITNNPENTVLQYLKYQGWIGEHTEGHTIQSILRTLILPALIDLNPFAFIGDESTPYMQMMHTIIGLYTNPEFSRHKLSDNDFIQMLHTLINSRINLPAPVLQEDFDSISMYMSNGMPMPSKEGTPIDLFLDATTNDFWHNLLNIYAKKDGSLGYGWPDLELTNGEEVMLVEVKVKDYLTGWQKQTIPTLISLGLNCKIIRIVPIRHL